MHRPQKIFEADFGDDDLVQPHVLCERCQDICNRSQLLRDVPTKYSIITGEEFDRPGADDDDVTESYTHGTVSEIEASCLKGCFFCVYMYYSTLKLRIREAEDLWEAARISPDRIAWKIVARESIRDCRIQFDGFLSGHLRVYIDGGRCYCLFFAV